MTEAIDAEWFQAVEDLPYIDASTKALRTVPDIDGQKARFIAEAFAANPDLRPTIDLTEVNTHEQLLLGLRKKLEKSNADPLIIETYIPLLDGRLSSGNLKRAAVAGDTDSFMTLMLEEYDEPQKPIFNALADHFRQSAEQALSSPHAAVREAAKEVLAVVPDVSAEPIWPTEDEFQAVKRLYADYFDVMFAGIEFPENVSGAQAVPIIEKVLKNVNCSYSVVAQDEGLNDMAVNHKKEVWRVPVRKIEPRLEMMGSIGHEVQHIVCRLNGLQQPLQILSKGLKNSGAASEGKSVLIEQIVYDNLADFQVTQRFWDIARRHLSIGLARGLDGNGQRDFKDVFPIINAIDKLRELQETPDQPQRALVKAIDRTWELLTKRTLKGVVGKGAAYFQPKDYAEGNVNQFNLQIRHPEVLPYLDKGKYDLTIPEHRRILKQIGVIPVGLLATS